LSDRQLECLAWAQEGKSAGDIGQIIGISGRTVEGHLAKACEALGVRTRVQAVVRARDLGLLTARAEVDVAPSAATSLRSAPRV
jgi:DNA-binding CsgD family transcriptional regulator